MRGEARVAASGWGSSDSTRAFRAGPTAAASARLLTWYAAPSSCAALKSCKTQHSNCSAMTFVNRCIVYSQVMDKTHQGGHSQNFR